MNSLISSSFSLIGAARRVSILASFADYLIEGADFPFDTFCGERDAVGEYQQAFRSLSYSVLSVVRH